MSGDDATMRAAVYSRTGPARDVLSVQVRPRPVPGPGDVRVRVAWSGVNPSDTKARAGTRSPQLPYPEVIPHSDGSGVIDAVGAGVPAARVGERVWLRNAAWGRPHGTAAEFVVLPSAQAVPLPDGVPLDVGACLGIPALTACHALAMAGGVAGRRVLVQGGAGAVGHYAVQMARLLGASQVLATVSSPEKARIALAAGADAVVDYRREDVVARVDALTGGAGIDRIVEVDLAANARADFAMLAPGGLLVAYGSGAPEAAVPFVPGILKNLQVAFFIVYHLPDADRAVAEAALTSWLRDGALEHRIAARLPLADIADAHALVEAGTAVGNVVLAVSGER
jgi:NADPH2:quinone reductase